MRPVCAWAIVMALAVIAPGAVVPALAGPADDVAAATKAWTDRFSGHDLEGLLALYDRDAVFWGTSSQTLRDTPDLIRDYFKGVPTSSMTVAVTDSRVRVLGDVADQHRVLHVHGHAQRSARSPAGAIQLHLSPARRQVADRRPPFVVGPRAAQVAGAARGIPCQPRGQAGRPST